MSLQPSLAQRDLLARSFQRIAAGETTLPAADRQDLAMRALTSLSTNPQAVRTPGDPLQQIGVERLRAGGALGLTGSRTLGMEMLSVCGRGGEVHRQQWQAGSGDGPTLRLSMLNVDEGFARLDALTSEERAWVGGMRGMRRLEFGGEKLSLGGGKAELGLLELAHGDARARRMSLGFAGSRWSVRALSQRADDSFQRLGDLTEADRKLFGAERGIARDSLELGYALSGSRKLTATNLSLRADGGTARRRSLEYVGGPGLQLRFLTGQVDSGFNRIGDLLEADKNSLAPQHGTRWSDFTANLRPARWLTTENQWYRSTSLESGRQTTQLRNLWTMQLASKSKLILFRSLMEAPTGEDGRRQALTQSARLEQWLGRTLFFSGFRETARNSSTDGPDSDRDLLALQLKTGPGPKLQASADYSLLSPSGGQDERALKWTLGLPLRKGLLLQAKGDRREVEGSPAAQTLAMVLAGKVTSLWDLSLTLNRAESGKSPATQDLGVRLTFAGLGDTPVFKETRLVLGLGDTQGLPSVVPTSRKPPTGPAGPEPRRARSLTLQSKFKSRPVALGYVAAAGAAGGLTYQFSTDPKAPLQLEAAREVRDLGRTSLVGRERYACRARVAKVTQVSLSYETQPEQSPGKLMLEHAVTRAEAQTKLGELAVAGAVGWDRDRQRGATSALTSLSVAGSLDSRNSVRVSYTGRSGPTDPALPCRDIRLSYERKPEETLLVALHANWRAWEVQRADELAWQLDLTAVF
jgi:hypothetical protein